MNQQIITAINAKPVTADSDGYYGVEPSEECKQNAQKFLSSMPKYFQDIITPSEHITPTTNGTIIIDWYYRKQFVSVEVGNTLVGFFSDFDDGINPECHGIAPEKVRPVVVQALNKLYKYKRNES